MIKKMMSPAIGGGEFLSKIPSELKNNNHRGVLFSVFFVTVISLLQLFPSSAYAAATFGGGTGTQSDPYIIKTLSQWNSFAQSVFGTDQNGNGAINYSGQYIRLDADLSSTFNVVGAYPDRDPKSFAGNFDGNGHTITITGLTNFGNNPKALGLFGKIENATIENLNISFNATITSNKPDNGAGILCGYSKNSKIISCSVTGASGSNFLKGNGEGEGMTGGLIGYADAGTTVSKCSVLGSLTLHGGTCGGLIGKAVQDNLVIEDCIIQGTAMEVAGKNQASGGLVGELTGSGSASIDNCIVSKVTVSSQDGNNLNQKEFGLAGGTASSSLTISNIAVYMDPANTYVSNNALVKGISSSQVSNVCYSDPTLKGKDDATRSDGATATDPANLSKYGYLIGAEGSHFVLDADGNLTIDPNVADGDIQLWVDKWNFVSSLVTNLATLNNNKGENTSKQHDMAAVGYNYTEANWSGDYLAIANNDNLNAGEGYFVYVFKYAPLDSYEDATSTTTGTDLSADTYVRWNQGTTAGQAVSGKELGASGNKLYNNVYWFALGNPFYGQLDIAQFISANNSIQGKGVYVWNAINQTWNPNTTTGNTSGQVDFAQGFMVASSSNESLTFNIPESAKVSSSKKSASVKSANNTSFVFTSQANSTERSAYAVLDDAAGNGFEHNDMVIMLNSNKDFVEPYFVVDNHNVIENYFQSLPYEENINFHASKTSDVKFTASNIAENVDVYVMDLENETETLISDGTVFEFTAFEGENANRFKIKFIAKNSSIENLAQDVDINITNSNRNINISGKDLQKVELINSLGQITESKQVNADYVSLDAKSPAGVYIVKVKSAKGDCQKKIVIQ